MRNKISECLTVLLFLLTMAAGVEGGASAADRALTLAKASSRLDAGEVLEGLLDLVSLGGEENFKAVRDRLLVRPLLADPANKTSPLVVIDFFKKVAQVGNASEFLSFIAMDKEFLKDVDGRDAFYMAVAYSPACRTPDWIKILMGIGKWDEKFASLSLSTLAGFRSDEGFHAAFDLLADIPGGAAKGGYIARTFAFYRSYPAVISAFRSMISGLKDDDALVLDVVAVNFDIWNENWSQRLALALRPPQRMEYGPEALREIVLLEDDLLGRDLPQGMKTVIGKSRESDVHLLEKKLAEKIIKELRIPDWGVQVFVDPPKGKR